MYFTLWGFLWHNRGFLWDNQGFEFTSSYSEETAFSCMLPLSKRKGVLLQSSSATFINHGLWMFRGAVLRQFLSQNWCYKLTLWDNELFMQPCFKNSSLSIENISELNWWSNSTNFDAIESPWCFLPSKYRVVFSGEVACVCVYVCVSVRERETEK